MCRLRLFVLDSHLATLWESKCPFGFLLVMFPLGSSYFVFVFLSLWCLWWEVWDNCVDSWSLPSFLFYCNRNSNTIEGINLVLLLLQVLVLLFVALWFILRGDLFYVLPCVILFLCFSVLLASRLPRFGKRELILVLFVRLFDLCLFGFVGFLFLLGSGKGWLWHSLDFPLTFFLTSAHSSISIILSLQNKMCQF